MESRNPQESIDSPDNKEEQNSSKSEGSITDALEWTYDEIIKHQTKKPAIYLKHYWKLLFLIALYYSVPAFQFVNLYYQQRVESHPIFVLDNTTETLIYCYYNYKCLKPFLGLEAFNNIISNIFYVTLGIVFLVIVRWNSTEDLTVIRSESSDEESYPNNLDSRLHVNTVDSVEEGKALIEKNKETHPKSHSGLHHDQSLYYCCGWCLIFEGIFSALYHVCPSRLAFQFDTTFMIIGSGLLFLTLYSKRHPTVISGPFRVFGIFAFIIILNCVSLINLQYRIFWFIILPILCYVSIAGSFQLYYNKRITWRRIKKIYKRGFGLPMKKTRFLGIAFANLVNFTYVIFGLFYGFDSGTTQDFPSFVLGLEIIDIVLYLLYYILMKKLHKEKVSYFSILLFFSMLAFANSAVYFYTDSVTNKFLSPLKSEELNKPCALFNYFDYHDIWHCLSAFGIFTLFLLVYSLDSDLEGKRHEEISVF